MNCIDTDAVCTNFIKYDYGKMFLNSLSGGKPTWKKGYLYMTPPQIALTFCIESQTGQRAQDVRHHLHDLSRTGQADARRASVPSGHLCPALLPAPHAGNQYHRPAPMVCPCRRGGFLAGGSFYFGKLVRLKASIITLLLQERDKWCRTGASAWQLFDYVQIVWR